MRKLLPPHVVMDVATQLAVDVDMIPCLFRLRGMAGAQPRLPKPLNSTKGRQRKKMMRTRKSMKRSRWNNHRSTNRRRHHCLTSLRSWLLRLSGCSA